MYVNFLYTYTMKTSILIIAHNEEKYIADCIASVLNQSTPADEVVLVAHNCTDQTTAIAKRYPISIVEYAGPKGITHARIRGLQAVTGDIILCIDGDSYAQKNWVREMTTVLKSNDNILVGSWIKFTGSLFGRISNLFNKYFCVVRNEKAASWIWGPSFAFWGKDTAVVQQIFEKTFSLSEALHLSRNPDDYWLALMMQQRGNIEVICTTFVTQHTKETTSLQALARNRENIRNAQIMRLFAKSGALSHI